MRTIKQILKDYLKLINFEKNLGYSEEEILDKVNDTKEFQTLKKLLLEELYDIKEIQDQLVSSERAYYIFCKCVIKTDIRSGRNVWNKFIKKQFLIIENNKQCCYMAHRGVGKSFGISIYTSFKMFLLPMLDVCYCSNVPRQKKRWIRNIRSIIDNNELLLEKKDVKGVASKSVPWGNDEFEYNDGILEGTTIGTTPRGGHYNLVIGDDVLREDKKYTNEYIVNYFQGILKPTTYTKKARYIIQGTPSDSEDLFHTLMNDKLDNNNRPVGKIKIGQISAAGFYSAIFPAILSFERKEVLLDEIWTFEELMAEKSRIGEIRFNREMLCQCGSYKNSLIGSALFKSCCDETLTLLQKGESNKKYLVFVDSATSDAPTADYCAMTVWEDDHKNNKLILRNLFHAKGYPITDPTGGSEDQTNKLIRFYNDFNKATIIIEKNNAGVALSQSVQAKGIEVIEHYTHNVSIVSKNRTGKANDVIDYIEYGLKSGIIVFPSNYDDIYTIDTLEKVKTEHLNFGVKKGKNGEQYMALAGKDDIFDSCCFAFKYRGDNIETLPFALTYPGS